VLARLGSSGEAQPPLLDELAVSSRALRWLERGELARAWREVGGRLSPTPIFLRDHIVELTRRSDTADAQAARVLVASGDVGGAWSRISGSLAGKTQDPETLLAAAEVQLARSNPQQAHSYLESLDSADARVQIALGRAYALQKQPGPARQALTRAAQLDPENPRPLLLVEELAAPPPAELARVLTRAGAREAQRLSPRRAERLLKRAVQIDRTVAADAWRERGRLETRVGRPARALEAWRSASAAGADDSETWTGIGRAQHALGDADAMSSLERAISMEPRNSDALTELGQLHMQFGRAEPAIPLLREAVASAPSRSDSRLALAQALRATGRPDEGLEVLNGPEAPTAASAETLREVAALQRDAGDLEAAQHSLERASALEPWNPELREDLAGVLDANGDAARAAELRNLAVVLGAADGSGALPGATGGDASFDFDLLVLSFSRQLASASSRRVTQLGLREPDLREPQGWKIALLRWLHPRSPDTARLEAALEQALALRFDTTPALLPESPVVLAQIDALYAFEQPTSLDAEAIANVNSALGTDAVFVAQLVRLPVQPENLEGLTPNCADPSRYEIELRMLSGQHADLASILVATDCLPAGASNHGAWNHRAAGVYAALLLLLLFPALRGWGRVLVKIELPPKTKGFLSIHVTRKPKPARGTEKKRRMGNGRLKRSLSSFSRYRKRMVGRETLFRWLPARRVPYYVTVEGPLYDAMGDQVIGNFLEEQRVRIERGQTAKLTYDFNPSEVAVQVSVVWNGKPVRNARVALRDDPSSLRYARDGSVFFYLGKGAHALCAGAGDRATERGIEIDALDNAIPVDIDLSVDEGLMVRGCEEAVEPYLIGDFSTAADRLQAAGEEQLAHLMRGAHFQQRGELENAANEFEAAGCIEEAAELRASGADLGGSAALFERAGDFARAAESYRGAGDLSEAGRCYEAAYDYDNAIECYEAVDDMERVMDLREKQGAYLEAAAIAQRFGKLDRALQNLKAIERRDPNYGEGCRMISEILAERGEFGPAAERMAQAIEIAGNEAAPVEMHETYAQLLEQATDKARALEAYETVRRLDPGRDDLTRHIAQLRDELSVPPGGPSPAAGSGAVESRYEILGELGRGGMGVVYKARDKRLDRIVALKQLPDNLRQNQTAAKLFLREARAAAALNHTNIVTLYDADEENGVFHITMELLEGANLAEIQERRGRLATRDVARLGIQVCAGLQYAHDARVVHRDIKTGNLFFTRDKVVKILDFGLAKTIEEVRKNSTVIGGTPYYMAPEQAIGGAVDARTDLYALGITLYRLLTSSFPFVEGDLSYHHRETPPPDPRQHAADIPESMARLVLGLLAKDPDCRPRNAAEVGEQLRGVVAGS